MPWQPTAVLYPDAELVVTTRLRALLAGRSEAVDLYIGNSVPNPRRDRMLVVRRDGGPTEDFRDVARINLRAWTPRDYDATALWSLAAALLRGCADGAPILRVEQQSGPIAVADESGQALRFGVLEIHTRGSVLT